MKYEIKKSGFSTRLVVKEYVKNNVVVFVFEVVPVNKKTPCILPIVTVLFILN